MAKKEVKITKENSICLIEYILDKEPKNKEVDRIITQRRIPVDFIDSKTGDCLWRKIISFLEE